MDSYDSAHDQAIREWDQELTEKSPPPCPEDDGPAPKALYVFSCEVCKERAIRPGDSFNNCCGKRMTLVGKT